MRQIWLSPAKFYNLKILFLVSFMDFQVGSNFLPFLHYVNLAEASHVCPRSFKLVLNVPPATSDHFILHTLSLGPQMLKPIIRKCSQLEVDMIDKMDLVEIYNKSRFRSKKENNTSVWFVSRGFCKAEFENATSRSEQEVTWLGCFCAPKK